MSSPEGRRWTGIAWGLIGLSALLRAILVTRGGQMLWNDESRYAVAREAVAQWSAGNAGAAWRALWAGADHLLFKWIALVPAALERGLGTPPDLIPGYFFAAASVVNIWLVWRIALRAGAGPREAVIAMGLFAGAATNFYYARHLFPYDLSLIFGLWAIHVGWFHGGGVRSFLCGVLAGCGFLTYNGSWLFGALALVGHTLGARPSGVRAGAMRAILAAAGLALPILLATGFARSAGVDLVGSFLRFSRTIDQGDFGRGWKLLLEYFWAAEGLNFIMLLALLAVAGTGALLARRRTRGATWLAAAGFVVAGLVLLSDVWPKFVIYGRTARLVVPLACLAAAAALETLFRLEGGPRRLAGCLVIAFVGQAIANFAPPLAQVVPREFYRQALRLKQELRSKGETRQLSIVYADTLVDHRALLASLPDHDELLAAPNPISYAPYLFEGYPEEARALLRKSDVRMRLIAVNQARFDHPAELRRPYPGVVRMTLRLPDVRPPGVPEPLVVTGETGRGDFVYLIYQEGSAIRIGYDHWDGEGLMSDPIPIDPTQPVVVTVSMGPMHGALASEVQATYSVDPRDWLYVEVNGQVVWSRPARFHTAVPASISYLVNYIGGSTAGVKFSGRVLKLESLLLPPFADQAGETR